MEYNRTDPHNATIDIAGRQNYNANSSYKTQDPRINQTYDQQRRGTSGHGYDRSQVYPEAQRTALIKDYTIDNERGKNDIMEERSLLGGRSGENMNKSYGAYNSSPSLKDQTRAYSAVKGNERSNYPYPQYQARDAYNKDQGRSVSSIDYGNRYNKSP